jgi:hypothetical protein
MLVAVKHYMRNHTKLVLQANVNLLAGTPSVHRQMD